MATGRNIWISATAGLAICMIAAGSPTRAADILAAPAPVAKAPPLQRTMAGELGVHAGWIFRGGNAVNGSGDTANSERTELPLLGAAGRILFNGPSGYGLQFDAEGEAYFPKDRVGGQATRDTPGGHLVAAAHASYRNADGNLVGLFGGVGRAFIDDEGGDFGGPFWFAGIEGRMHQGSNTWYGQAGWLDSDARGDNELLARAWFVRGVARHFFAGGHAKVQAEISYARGKQDSDGFQPDRVSVLGWGAEYEQQWMGLSAPDRVVSGFLAYQGTWFAEKSGADRTDRITDHAFKAGVRVKFGVANLADYDRNGASLDLPNLGHWTAGVVTVD